MKAKQSELQRFLGEELLRRMRANSRYSQRAFARDLGLSAGELSESLRGLRSFTHKTALKIATKLGLSQFEKDRLLENSGEAAGKVEVSNTPTPLSFFELVTDPVTCSLFCLLDVEGFRWDPKWIARRLGVSQLEVDSAFRKLMEHKVLQKMGRGYQADLTVLSSPQDIPSLAVRELHRHYLDRARQALDLQEVASRHINGLSLALRKKDLEAAKRDVSVFIDHFEKKYARGKIRDAVYHLEVALFRLDREG